MTLEEKIAELKVGDKIKFEGQEYIVINRKRNKLDLKAGTLSRKISVEELIEKLKNPAKVEEVSQEEIAKIVGSEEEKEDPNRKTYKNYPYNFVSLGDKNKVERKPYSDSIGNNSGKLICSLVNKTPIFTNGETSKTKKGHSLEEFLMVKGKYTLPSSSIKGEVRNIIEVLTNSCIKNVENERLEKRLNAGENNNLKFGIIKKIPTDKDSGTIEEAVKIKVNRKLLNKYKEGFYPIKVSKSILHHYTEDNDIKGKFAINTDEELEKILNNGTEEAMLWISSYIYNKRFEKIIIAKSFIRPKEKRKIYKFSFNEYKDLLYLIKQRKEREKKTGKKFYLSEKEEGLKTGDVIIFNETEDEKAINLTFSEIPRLRFELSPLDLVPEEFRPCSNIKNLCFACRLFGSTGDQKKDSDKDKNKDISCIGKVYFTDATMDKKEAKIVSKPILLKPLGEPHPSLTRFYLRNGTYDDKNKIGLIIRGRKFYWHHTNKIEKNYEEYYDSIKDSAEEKYNASLKFLKPGNKFEFEVSFKNLTDEELGVLIYSLELEDNLLHKFGKAKAFGFGSSKITIEKFLLDSKDKYRSFTKTYDEGNKEKYLKIAKAKYLDEKRKEIRELKAILNIVNDLDFSKSPFPEERKVDSKGKITINTLNWFSKNKDVYLAEILEKVK